MILLARILTTLLVLFITCAAFSQLQPALTAKQMRWQHLALDRDSVYGISMDRTYQELLKGKKREIIIVAVIDSGTDTLHLDLKPILWRNSKEHGLDEDGNGYKNDRYGWNFLGVKEGNGPIKPGFEYQRVYLSLKNICGRYSDQEILNSGNKDCITWLSAKEKFRLDSTEVVSSNLIFWKQVVHEDSSWRKVLGKQVYGAKDLTAFIKRTGMKDNKYLVSLLGSDSTDTNQQLFRRIEEAKVRLLKKYSQDPAIHRAETIGDDYNNLDDRFYGDPHVRASSDHGTHVAGIIGAVRNNGTGIDGIADAVCVMPIRAVYSGADEYDKDVALAIRYAVDNGAKVVNMSFGKLYSPQRKWVEEAIQYAAKKDVLIVHAAGNDASNTDSTVFYPTSKYLSGEYAPNMITVGASGAMRKDLIAAFSNYGKQTVDVFAPGVNIYSDVVDKNGFKYSLVNGTSIAAPVVTGLAAVIRSYYPKLSAEQVKNIIESSATRIDGYVTKPGKGNQQVLMTELCKSGGIVNAYEAVKMAEKIKRSRD